MDTQQKRIINITHKTESKRPLEMGIENNKEIWQNSTLHNRENDSKGTQEMEN